MQRGLLFVVTGPSGAGKTTLIKNLISAYPELQFSVSFTTRLPRINEVNGVDYWFVTENTFFEEVKTGDLLEYASVHGYYYGTSKKYVERQLKQTNVLLDIDVQGALNVKKIKPDCVVCFVAPPGYEHLYERLKKRGTESDADLKKRMTDAVDELKKIEHFDYLIVNCEPETSSEEMIAIYKAENLRVPRRIEMINEFKTIDKGGSIIG